MNNTEDTSVKLLFETPYRKFIYTFETILLILFLFIAYQFMSWDDIFDLIFFPIIFITILLSIWMTPKSINIIHITEKSLLLKRKNEILDVEWKNISQIKYLSTTGSMTYVWIIRKKDSPKMKFNFFIFVDSYITERNITKLKLFSFEVGKYTKVKGIFRSA